MSALLTSQLRRSIALLERELLVSLRKAFLEALDESGMDELSLQRIRMTDEALSAALRKHRLVISREPPRPRAKPYFIEVLPHGDTL